MHAPQVIYIIMAALQLVIHTTKHGQRRDPYNAVHTVLDLAIMTLLIWWGGFFG